MAQCRAPGPKKQKKEFEVEELKMIARGADEKLNEDTYEVERVEKSHEQRLEEAEQVNSLMNEAMKQSRRGSLTAISGLF